MREIAENVQRKTLKELQKAAELLIRTLYSGSGLWMRLMQQHSDPVGSTFFFKRVPLRMWSSSLRQQAFITSMFGSAECKQN